MNFDLDDFKKWMKNQPREDKPEHKSRLIGLEVECKLNNAKRIAHHITDYNGDLHELAVDFLTSGGQIVDVLDKEFLIEVSCGTFTIHRCYVKKN
jgi:hypothetical protein